jgi:biotin carboxyl carrier protein
MTDLTPCTRARTARPGGRTRRLPIRAFGVGLLVIAAAAFSLPVAAIEVGPPTAPARGVDLDVRRLRAEVASAVQAAAAEARAKAKKDAEAKKKPAPPPVFAVVHGQELRLPARNAVIVGFHEASYPVAFPMAPVGNQLADDHVPKPDVVPWIPVPAAAPNYVIMSSRGRPHAATSAVDIVPGEGDLILSPVTGTVVKTEHYDLYGKYPDNRVEIVPDGRPDLTITMLHVWRLRVKPGERVVAGESAIAKGATRFPFTSHIDAYAGGHPPHVHIEAKINP